MKVDVVGHSINELLDNPYLVHVATLRSPETTLAAIALRRTDKKWSARVFIYDQHSGVIVKEAASSADWDRSKQKFSPRSFGFTIAMETNEYYLAKRITDYALYRAIIVGDEDTIRKVDPLFYGLCCLRRAAHAETPSAYETIMPVGENYWTGNKRIKTEQGEVINYRKISFRIPPKGHLDRVEGPSRVTYECRFETTPKRNGADGSILTLTRYYLEGYWPTLDEFMAEERNQNYIRLFLEEKKLRDANR
ncbi:hypothetical protein pEaSNUABM11_00132 [Erwinia phage pEa_SNUABM_11]|nr:hypothetical protein pEaSNUABM11_00132 [Erwinia phage pEa_SNUABM_11]